MKSIKFILLVILLICVQSYAQQDEKTMAKTERIAYVKSNIKKYKKEPLYQIGVETNCHYRVLINGFPMANCFNDLGGSFMNNTNHCILESGVQDVEIQIYPNDNQDFKFSEENKFRLDIVKTAWEDGSLADPEKVFLFELQKEVSFKKYKELPVYVIKNKFTAKVPYKLEGWKNAKAFDVKDSLNLKKKLHKRFEIIRNAYRDNKEDFFKTQYLKADTEWSQSEYFDDKTIQRIQNFSIRGKTYRYGQAPSNRKGNEYFPLENYKVAYYCNNKIARLEILTGMFKGESLFGYLSWDHLARNEAVLIDLFYMENPKTGELVIVR